ncbi:MAG TPA: TonB C-terminal domain-containing protein [Longimicrobiales bacterium]
MAERTRSPKGEASTWGARLRRHRSRPPARALVASVLLHVLVIAGFWLAGIQITPEPDFVQYRVTLVSPPPQEEGEQEEVVTPPTPVVIEPEPEPPAPEPEPDPPKPDPDAAKPPTSTPREVEKEPDPEPVKGPDPKPSTAGGENLNVQLEGEEFPYPDYLENIVRTLHNYFRWSGASNLEAEVVFYIRRDGTVGGIRIVRKSGNFQFDLQAHEAVDRAGRTGAFGALPDGWQQDRLWISFTFEPAK